MGSIARLGASMTRELNGGDSGGKKLVRSPARIADRDLMRAAEMPPIAAKPANKLLIGNAKKPLRITVLFN